MARRPRQFAEAGPDLLDFAPEAVFGTPGPEPAPGHLGHRERIRERLLARGAEALAEYEVLEVLLFANYPRQDTKPVAKALIARFGSLARVLAARPEELQEVERVGPGAAGTIKAAQAAALAMLRTEAQELPVLNNWDRLLAYLTAALAREPIEQFRVIFLDTKNRLIADEAQARGTVNHTPVYPREVVKRALELGATALILVHNHPSGDPTPSRADIEMTAEVKAAAAALGIVLHDHLIIGNGRHLSFRREGLL
ncbi:RadC family protein [Roseomonas sp. AR75]|jgi:DNA repair protein RadC|uniref:RadC family protein n=1 Tax=Roseomonas sp. AR75 TaxID=2562311 RepID=UPI0010C05719|nr:DNA repair protein RadC [Roseomonas sp. AR75]